MIPMFHIKARKTVRRSFSSRGLLLLNILMLIRIYLQIEPLLLSGKHVMVVAHANSLRSMIMYLDELTSEEVKNEIHKFQAKFLYICCIYISFHLLYRNRLSTWNCQLEYLCCTYVKKENLSEEEVLLDPWKLGFMLIQRFELFFTIFQIPSMRYFICWIILSIPKSISD